ncbi:phage recombination protein Bet [Hydrogenimonas urashimensis]|uniref:phage recombination protein Bet n=1 Tax=Hydrogenimonas urashimensis TaxID=2740515 RepID=UPI0019154C91|nr:phage recombination protein Bet [Hydrogenimonas urashimensis]
MSQLNEKAVVRYNIGDTEIKLTPKIVTDYLTNGANITMPEFKLFTELCKARKLNPFLKEAYIIKYGNNPAQIVVGKDAILKRAINHPQFDGREQGIIVQKPDGTIEERRGTFHLPDEALVGGWAKVYRKDWHHPTYITVSFDEVAQRKGNGELNSNWATKGATMVEKVALVRALRETFVEDLGGMIDEDEAWKEDAAPHKQSEQHAVSQPDPFQQAAPIDAEIEEIDMNDVPA